MESLLQNDTKFVKIQSIGPDGKVIRVRSRRLEGPLAAGGSLLRRHAGAKEGELCTQVSKES